MSKKSRARKGGAAASLLAEEATQLLIHSGLAAASVYAIGSVPFVIGLIAYVGTMAHDGRAHLYLGTGALGLALLFMWMKVFQARFAQHLRARLRDEALPPWTVGAFFATLCRQSILHATVVFVYPIAFITLLPMGYAAAMYQNASVLDDGRPMAVRELASRALGQARLWPKQNHLLLWLCSPLMVCVGAAISVGTFPLIDSMEDEFLVSLGGIYAGVLLLAALPLAPFAVTTVANVASAIFLSIEFFHVFTGADTVYARNPGALLGNDLFVALACGVTYLLLDPILKAAYVIRCHEGESLETGADLRVILRRIRRMAACLLVGVMAFSAVPAHGDTPVLVEPTADVDASPLNDAIDKELTERRYTWRMPREPQPEVELPWLLQLVQDFGESVRGWLKAGFDFVVDVVEEIWDWFFGDPGRDESAAGSGGKNFNQSIRILVGVLGVLLLAVTIYLIWRAYRDRAPKALAPLVASGETPPDLNDESTTAADLPEDEWFQLARELAGQGDFRLASRALFFSILATLAQHEIIRLARFKTNMDYRLELGRRATSIGDTPKMFSESALLFESVWYGEHEATDQTLQRLHACQEAVRHGLR